MKTKKPFDKKTALKNSREDWLVKAVDALTSILVDAGYTKTNEVWVSVGFPKGSRGRSGKAIGQCWPGTSSRDGSGHIFISPELHESTRVLDVLLHEVGHDVVGCEHGHKKPFADFCRKVGLNKPWTATTASDELQAKLEKIVTKLGPYPHAALVPAVSQRKQSTRMRKYVCSGDCGQIIRAATDDLDATCNGCEMPFERS